MSSLRMFYFLREMCPQQVLRLVYFSLVNSTLEYGITCWGGTYKTNIHSLVVLQNLFIKMILKKSIREPSHPCFLRLNILPLRSLFLFKVLKIFYLRSGYIQNDGVSYKKRLRNARNACIPRPYNTFYQKTFEFIAPKIFNKLPDSIKSSKNSKLFIKKVRNG